MLRVLGPISIEGPDGRSRSLSRAQRHLLAVLVAAGPSGITLDALADELWSDALPSTWSASLRNHLTRLRVLLGSAELPTRGGVCRLDLASDEVDAWLLLAPRTPTEWTDDLAWLLEPRVPYEDVEPSDRLAQSANRILSARHRILEGFLSEPTAPVSVAVRDVMRLSATADPFDERLTIVSATADARAGEVAVALKTIEANAMILRRELGDLAGHSLDDFAKSLVSQGQQSTEAQNETPSDRRFPDRLSGLAASSRFGRDQQLADAHEWVRTTAGVRHLAVEGDWAAGKSRFVAQLARLLFDDGAAIRFTSGSPSSLAYEGILAALPELRPALDALAERLLDQRTDVSPTTIDIERTVFWSRAADTVERLGAARPLVLVIDNFDRLDTPSLDLLAFLLRSSASGSSILLTASLRRAVGSHVGWGDAGNRNTVVLDPLDLAAITTAVEQAFPAASPSLVSPLAEATMRLSGGLPILVRAVLDATSPVSFEPPTDLRSTADVIASLLAGVDAPDVLVGAAVAVLGRGVVEPARVTDIATVADHSVESALEALDRLVERGLLLNGPRPDAFRVRHSPAAKALLTAPTRSQIRAMHATAAGLSKTSHAASHHLVAALPSIDHSVAVTALEASANDYLVRGAVHEAMGELRLCEQLADGGMSVRARSQMAICLSRLGQFDDEHLVAN